MLPSTFAGVRAVLFDAVGTLIHAVPPVEAAYRQAGMQCGIDLPEADLRQRFRAAFARQEQLDSADALGRTGAERERRRWQSIVFETFAEATDKQKQTLFDALWRHYAAAAAWQVDPAAEPVFQALASAELILGIASNFDDRLLALAAGLPPLDRVQNLFVSSELGYRKPAGGFFAAIEQRLGLAPREILLVGDHLHNDYLPAIERGWHALLLSATPPAEIDALCALSELPFRLGIA